MIECYCTDSTGGRIELGEVICLRVDGRSFTAQCQMSQNVPMWRELNSGCVSAALPQSVPKSALQDPAEIQLAGIAGE
ncbi:hypothetical protein ACRARG_20330 [Pseudooceanicola sp. C21-150M6]